ncbi:phage/plasmid primase, P4 family, partial [Komagataeibacter europaeus]|uniref:phage/plasmid primase, P4 family n=1 Tax=Komagataeibacter europaeus TaxID=33995 RepID=UPI000678A010
MLELVQSRRNLDKAGALDFIRTAGANLEPIKTPSLPKARLNVVKEYFYHDEQGQVLFRVARMEPKTFRQWSGSTGHRPLGETRRVLYRLPSIIEATPDKPIFIVEGEKDADNLVAQGLIATCNPMGASAAKGKSKWRHEYSDCLKGRHVIIVADNDEAGRTHANVVATSVLKTAASVRVVDLPDLPEKGDVSDWLEAGHTGDELQELVSHTPFYHPDPDSDARTILKYDSKIEEDLTEDGIALAFARLHQDDLRYDHTRGSWYHWTGKAWRRDETKLAFSWARRVCRHMAKEAGAENKLLATLAKASTAAAVERYAQSDPVFARTSVIWDDDPFLLGTPDGTLDLRSCQIRPANPDDHITRLTAVGPAETPDCPHWQEFLNQATNGDQGLIRFLRAWCGYTLTGTTREHALLFIYGPGGNGKSVFLNTVSSILGEYCTNAAMDTFTASNSDKHPTELAMLCSARLVTSNETEEGRAWAEARIKQLTGGDPISARFMRQDFFTFTPQFKLTITGNHKPVLQNVDDAARRRFNIVPFMFKPK